jgi:hypothetical protein
VEVPSHPNRGPLAPVGDNVPHPALPGRSLLLWQLARLVHDRPEVITGPLSRTPRTFLPGDWKLGNLGTHPDGRTILLDWASLEHQGIDTNGWWDRQLDLCMIAIMAAFGWEKALGDTDELSSRPGWEGRHVRTVILLVSERGLRCGFSFLCWVRAPRPQPFREVSSAGCPRRLAW